MTQSNVVVRGRVAFEAQAWTEAYTHLLAADTADPLAPDDLDRLATAAYLIGEDAAGVEARARAHEGFLERGESVRAARSAFWLVFALIDKPAHRAQAGGWLARASRLLDECGEDCVERGLLLCVLGFQKASAGDLAAARASYGQAIEIGARFRDPNVSALARVGEGRVLMRLDQVADGFALLDEVMVSVSRGEVTPMISGVAYCSLVGACYENYDLRRAQEWTATLAAWCAAHPDMVPFRGQCLVRRSELLQMHGDWDEAAAEAQRACALLTTPKPQPDAGAAYYQQAELLRLRGDFERADSAYRQASQAGRKPYPGLALLRLAQGQTEAADTAIRRVLQETADRRARARLLSAAIEIMVACTDLPAARAAAGELAQTAADMAAPLLRALSSHASGRVALAEGDPAAAGEHLRDAWTAWQQMEAPYEAARVRVLMGLAARHLGDEDGARLEFDAAAEVFERLGAVPDATSTTALGASTTPAAAQGLTGREVEVLRLIATGKTNRAIAGELEISEKTVARHVSNIFTKLDLPSRSAATAYAYEHKLV